MNDELASKARWMTARGLRVSGPFDAKVALVTGRYLNAPDEDDKSEDAAVTRYRAQQGMAAYLAE